MLDWKNAALILVDIQKDFCSGGALAVPDGDAVVPVANKLIRLAVDAGCPVLFSRDMHPVTTTHFNSWPRHCVGGTPGSEYHDDLLIGQSLYPYGAVLHQVFKGMAAEGEEADAYSVFDGVIDGEVYRSVDVYLAERGVKHLIIAGLATDYCVRATAIDGIVHEYEVTVVLNGCRGVSHDTTEDATEEMEGFGVEFVIL